MFVFLWILVNIFLYIVLWKYNVRLDLHRFTQVCKDSHVWVKKKYILQFFSLKITCQAGEKGNGSISYKAVIFCIEFKRLKRASETFFSNEAAQPEVNGKDKLLEAVQCGAVPLTTFFKRHFGKREWKWDTKRRTESYSHWLNFYLVIYAPFHQLSVAYIVIWLMVWFTLMTQRGAARFTVFNAHIRTLTCFVVSRVNLHTLHIYLKVLWDGSHKPLR